MKGGSKTFIFGVAGGLDTVSVDRMEPAAVKRGLVYGLLSSHGPPTLAAISVARGGFWWNETHSATNHTRSTGCGKQPLRLHGEATRSIFWVCYCFHI